YWKRRRWPCGRADGEGTATKELATKDLQRRTCNEGLATKNLQRRICNEERSTMEEQNVGVSTPPASAAIAQSRQQAGAGQGEQEARGQELPELEFTIDANVLRAVMTRPYERQASDPLYRPLRIFSLDPSASKLEGSIATVNVPYEPLQPGPIGRFLEVDDYDSSEQRHWGRVDLDDHHVLLNDGRAPSTSDPLFHQQMVYVVAATVCAAFRRALGRHLCWGHGNTAADGKLSS